MYRQIGKKNRCIEITTMNNDLYSVQVKQVLLTSLFSEDRSSCWPLRNSVWVTLTLQVTVRTTATIFLSNWAFVHNQSTIIEWWLKKIPMRIIFEAVWIGTDTPRFVCSGLVGCFDCVKDSWIHVSTLSRSLRFCSETFPPSSQLSFKSWKCNNASGLQKLHCLFSLTTCKSSRSWLPVFPVTDPYLNSACSLKMLCMKSV